VEGEKPSIEGDLPVWQCKIAGSIGEDRLRECADCCLRVQEEKPCNKGDSVMACKYFIVASRETVTSGMLLT
jgi:hypothetical protein